jgi:hypothetical protein
MSAAEWREVSDVRSALRLAGRLWMCEVCCQRNCSGSPWRQEDCWACLGRPRSPFLTPRKLRLIACGICRFLGDELTGAPALRTVEMAERFADGLASPAQLASAHGSATAPAAQAATLPNAWIAANRAVDLALARLATLHQARMAGDLHAELTQVLVTAEATWGHLGNAAVKSMRKSRERRIRQHFAEMQSRATSEDAQAMTEVLRDLLGDPFERVRFPSACLEADGGRVRQVAQAIYEAGRFDEMPVLADALQDAGCSDARLLDHCLEDGHYRGCWLIDLLLGRE